MKTAVQIAVFFELVLLSLTSPFAAIVPSTNAFTFSRSIEPISAREGGQFGTFVSIKSNVVVFGNRIEPGSTSNTLATAFRLQGTSLIADGTLPAPGLTNVVVQDLATDGQRIVIAASENDVPVVYIFHRPADHWTLETTLRPSNSLRSISIDHGTIVLGASQKILIYEPGENSWSETTIPEPPTSSGDFGADVAIDRDTILVGAPGDSRGNSGGAFVYVRTSQTWQLQTQLTGGEFLLMPFGTSVALDGDTALVSAYPDRFDDGIVYVYERAGLTWISRGYLSGDDGGGNFFGESVAISGRNLIVGAPSTRDGGTVFLFRYNGDSFDTFRLSLQLGAFLGWAVAADGNTIIAGAPHFSSQAIRTGAGALFQFSFPPLLHSAAARFDDQSLNFHLADARIGSTYILETAPSLPSTSWSPVKEFEADSSEMQLQTDLSTGSVAAFYRLRLKEPPLAP